MAALDKNVALSYIKSKLEHSNNSLRTFTYLFKCEIVNKLFLLANFGRKNRRLMIVHTSQLKGFYGYPTDQ